MWARRAAIRCSCCWHVGRAVPGLSDARQTHEHKRARQRARPLGPWLRSRRQLEGRGQGRQPWWWKLLRARRAGIRCVCCWRVGRAVRGLSDAGQTHEHKRARHRACSSGLWFRVYPANTQQPQSADCGLLKTEMYAACAWGGRIRRFADHYEYTTCEHNLLNRLAIGKREHITGKCNGVPRASAFRWQYRDPERMK